MDWQTRYGEQRRSSAEAIAQIPRGKHIFISSGASEPVSLVQELCEQAARFADNHIVHLLTLGPAPYVDERFRQNFRHNAFFIGDNVREAVHRGDADYTPVFLSQIPGLMRNRRIPIDVALVQVSPPDPFGYVNLGVSVDVVRAAIEAAGLVIAEINPQMPVIYGAGFVKMSEFDAWVFRDAPLPELEAAPLDEVAREIGRNVAGLVGNGATLQMGIGQIPDAVLAALSHHRDLGVWTEMFSDGIIDLIENGNITNKFKTIHPNKVSSSFCFGSQRLYRFVDRNPMFTFYPSDYINDPIHIAQQHKMVAVNSALQIDLTGQVCADSIGTRFYSGIGGQVDFIRGASMNPGGKPIIAIRSTAKRGEVSRICAHLDTGAGVVTSRGDVRYVVTEYGVADLLGKSIRERAMSLISIAHPDFRSDLLAAAKATHYVFAEQIAPRASYPLRWETTVPTKDKGQVLLRPARVTDEDRIDDFFYNLSKNTVYQRWMSVKKRLPDEERLRFLEIDYRDNTAAVAEVEAEGQEPEIVALSRYHVDPATGLADVAFVVRDDWQGQGIGKQLFNYMMTRAREAGIEGFTADVLADNGAMLAVFHHSGLSVQSALVEGVYELKILFAEPGRRRARDREAPPKFEEL